MGQGQVGNDAEMLLEIMVGNYIYQMIRYCIYEQNAAARNIKMHNSIRNS